MPRPIDFAALTAPVSAQEVRAYRERTRGAGRAPMIVGGSLVAIAAVVVLIVAGSITAQAASRGGGASLGFLGLAGFGVLMFGGVVAIAVWDRHRVWRMRTRLDRFARANGMTYTVRLGGGLPLGLVFDGGRRGERSDVFRSAQGRELEFGGYQYTTGSGKSRRTHYWSYLSLELDRRLPHMVLDARANNGLFGGTNLPASFRRDQVLSLEGDFDRHFTLYCPREYERDALYVFTPDLMALLVDEAGPYDVEIVDDRMLLYSSTPFRAASVPVLSRLLRIVDTVGAKTLARTDRYRDEHAPVPFAADVVAPEGRRLRRRLPVLAIAVPAVAAALVIAAQLLRLAGH